MHRAKRPLMFPGENGSHGSVLLVTEPAGRAGMCAARAMLPHDPERNAIRTQRPPAYAGRRLANASGRRMFRNRQRSEEHTSELQSLMRNSYAVFCLKKKNKSTTT